MRLYFDTSALAKAYTSERGSADVDDFLARGTTVFLSDLNRVEMRCMLARRLRSGEISAVQEQAMWSQFLLDISNEFFEPIALPVPRQHLVSEGLGPAFVDYMATWKGFVEAPETVDA